MTILSCIYTHPCIHGHLFVRYHCTIERWPCLAAVVIVLMFHGHPFAQHHYDRSKLQETSANTSLHCIDTHLLGTIWEHQVFQILGKRAERIKVYFIVNLPIILIYCSMIITLWIYLWQIPSEKKRTFFTLYGGGRIQSDLYQQIMLSRAQGLSVEHHWLSFCCCYYCQKKELEKHRPRLRYARRKSRLANNWSMSWGSKYESGWSRYYNC